MKQLKNKRAAKSWQKKKRKTFPKFDLHAHKNSNKRTRKPISRRKVAAYSGILSLIVFLYFVIYGENLRVKNISVSGNENISVERLQEAVRNEMSGKLCGFLPGDNYLFVDENKIKSKLAADYTEIENVEVSLKFPNEIILNVKEKQSSLIWCRDACYYVNDQGVAFLAANEGELVKEQKNFIKIIEEAQIAEETQEERQSILDKTGDEVTVEDEALGEESEATSDMSSYSSSVDDIEAELKDSLFVLPAISLNEQIADASFIGFALEINRLVNHNAKMKIQYFKTKGYLTRELIGFTDKNTKLYFDTTKSAERQAKNLNYFLDEAIDKEKIDGLQYIYLKNEDRVFYK